MTEMIAQQGFLVDIERKIGSEPGNTGKLEFYLAALESSERLPNENPSNEIVICGYQNETIVKHALRDAVGPLDVATDYVVPGLPDNIQTEFSTPERIPERLTIWSKTDSED